MRHVRFCTWCKVSTSNESIRGFCRACYRRIAGAIRRGHATWEKWEVWATDKRLLSASLGRHGPSPTRFKAGPPVAPFAGLVGRAEMPQHPRASETLMTQERILQSLLARARYLDDLSPAGGHARQAAVSGICDLLLTEDAKIRLAAWRVAMDILHIRESTSSMVPEGWGKTILGHAIAVTDDPERREVMALEPRATNAAKARQEIMKLQRQIANDDISIEAPTS